MNNWIEEFGSELIGKINKSSIPEKEEMYRIAFLLSEISELVSDCALKFVILSIERIDSHILKLATILNESAEELSKIIAVKKPNGIKSHYDRLKNLKIEAGENYNEALSELFHFYKNSIDIMKYREIYDILNNGTKKYMAAAEVLDAMILRHS